MPVKNPVRELTEQEKRRIRQLVTQKCANFHEEYGCLPLDCDCVMLGKVFCGNAMCRYFRDFVLPNDPELNAAIRERLRNHQQAQSDSRGREKDINR